MTCAVSCVVDVAGIKWPRPALSRQRYLMALMSLVVIILYPGDGGGCDA